ncbi:aldo/keto reductase [Robertkochia solimangrovi]|uniref:aldo/keto reductase n=1 Tax=Robertkochia solimangrovi TaxID=2213046 RepID=UPI00117CA3E7|nr:aldo/keto reductase [Robertkochia solimangrovi]TRZ43618.1 aldo/keto reductase [Robertkochia solimangrovi]
MKYRKIGKTDIQAAPIVFGGNVFGWTLDEKASFDILDKISEKGLNFIDTADIYSFWKEGNKGGESETIIGNWMQKRRNRNEMIIATKVGGAYADTSENLTKPYIKKAAEDSLKRLKSDHIDLYYSHFDDNVTPVEETLSAYQELIQEGKVRFIAASNLSPDRLKASLELSKSGLPAYQALQPHYNLMERDNYETQYAGLVKEYGLSVFPYWALAAGFLTGKYREEADLSKSVRGEGVRKYLNEKGSEVLKALDTLAVKHESAQASIALAWLLHKPGITAPIASATKPQHLTSLLEAIDISLSEEDMNLLDKASS